jgi:hypothetical protein
MGKPYCSAGIGLDAQVDLTSIAEQKPNTSSNPKLHRPLDFKQT